VATGDIGAHIQSLEFDTNSGNGSKILHVAGNVYIIAYNGAPGQNVRLRTVSINAAGGISAPGFPNGYHTVSTYNQMNDLIHIAGNVYAVSYRAAGLDGRITTVTVPDDGLVMANISGVQFEAGTIGWSKLYHITGNVYAIVYQGPGDDGWIRTLTISNDGLTVAMTGASLEFDNVQGKYPQMTHIAGNVWGIVYQNASSWGGLQTVFISDDGLTITSLATINFHVGLCEGTIMVHVAGNIYAIAFRGASNVGKIRTVSISDDGLTLAATGLFFSTGNAMQVVRVFIKIAPNVFALPDYPGNAKGRLHTYNISNDGLTITEQDGASFSLINLTSAFLAMAPTAGNIYALAWSGTLQDGYVSTIDIDNLYEPSGQTDPATSVESAAATLNGTLIDDGNEACDCGFEWGETVAYGNTTPTQSRTIGQTFAQAISGLTPGATYHFRAIVTNGLGTSYGADRTFTTLGILSSATTDPATGVGMVLADLNGTLDDDGGEACDCGFEWGETVAYGNTTPTQSRTTGQTFAQAISGLTPGVTYHFRVIATNAIGPSYGADRTFTTYSPGEAGARRGYALSRHEL